MVFLFQNKQKHMAFLRNGGYYGNKQDGDKGHFPLLMSMSLPMVLSMLVQSLYNIIDSIYVSYLGTGALTAVSLAFPLQNIVLSVAVGIGVGIASVLSISLGKRIRNGQMRLLQWGWHLR